MKISLHRVSVTVFHSASACLLAAASWPALAQPAAMRAGLWEQTITLKEQGTQMAADMKQMQEQLAAMPPAQRAQMEKMMGGMGVKPSGSGITLKYCISETQAKSGDLPQSADHCTTKLVQKSGNSQRHTFNCTGPSPTSGQTDITFPNPTSYEGSSVVNQTVSGKPERMTSTMAGKWLSADCGSVKPVAPPKTN